MKKVSTVAVKQSRKTSEQKLTVGLDLGGRSSWYCVLDESGCCTRRTAAMPAVARRYRCGPVSPGSAGVRGRVGVVPRVGRGCNFGCR